jgi:hypothetical protein
MSQKGSNPAVFMGFFAGALGFALKTWLILDSGT